MENGKATSHLATQDEVVVPQVPDPENQAELPVPKTDNSIVAKDDCLAPVPWSGELGEDETDHECLDKAAKDGLKGHGDDGVGAAGGCLPGAVTYCVLGLQGKEEAGSEVVNLQDALVRLCYSFSKVTVKEGDDVIDGAKHDPGTIKTCSKHEDTMCPRSVEKCCVQV